MAPSVESFASAFEKVAGQTANRVVIHRAEAAVENLTVTVLGGQRDHQFSISEDWDIGVMGGDDELGRVPGSV